MTLENAKVLHAHLKKIGRLADLKSIEKRYPELAEKPKQEEGNKPKKLVQLKVKKKEKK